MAAIEDRPRHGPVHVVKRNKPAAVLLSEEDFQRLFGGQPGDTPGMSALQWLLAQPANQV